MTDKGTIKAAIVRELQRQRLEVGSGKYPIMQSIDIDALANAVVGEPLVITAGVDVQAHGARVNVVPWRGAVRPAVKPPPSPKPPER